MENSNFDLNTFSGNFAEFVAATVLGISPVTDLKKIKTGSLVIVKSTENKLPAVTLGLLESVKDQKLNIKLQLLDTKTVHRTIETLEDIFVIQTQFPSDFQGEHKKEFLKLVKHCLADVCKTERIGGLFLPSGLDKNSPEAIVSVQTVKEYFEKEFGVEALVRWSESGGKVQKIEGPCFNILLKNHKTDSLTEMFRAGAYHHSHRTLMVIKVNKDGSIKISNKGDEILNTMIEDYRSVAGDYVSPVVESEPEATPEAEPETAAKEEAVEVK